MCANEMVNNTDLLTITLHAVAKIEKAPTHKICEKITFSSIL